MLPNIALAWMMAQLKDFLSIDCSVVKADPADQELAATLHLEGEANPDSGMRPSSKPTDFVAA